MPSINEQLDELPVTGVRHNEAMGKLLLFPRTGIVGVPFEMERSGWNVVIVAGDATGVYQPGGWHIFVGRKEIERAVEVPLTELTQLRLQNPSSRNWEFLLPIKILTLWPRPGVMTLRAEGRYSKDTVIGVRVYRTATGEEVFSSRQVLQKDDIRSVYWELPPGTLEVGKEYTAHIGQVK